jgi:hypothetical protein
LARRHPYCTFFVQGMAQDQESDNEVVRKDTQ